jgi:2-phosphosulfolactate phosphatase
MDIHLFSLLEGARAATGTVVIIDVYRAYTTAAAAFLQGAEKIILVAEVNEALQLRAGGAGALCVGEVGGQRPPGFDVGNSPHEVSQLDLNGKTLIQSTRAGTVGAATAAGADRLFVASLMVAAATARTIAWQRPEQVSIVAMGAAGRRRTDEDEQCALYLRNLLEGRQPDPQAVRSLVLSGGESGKFDDPEQPWNHPEDRDWALRIDACDFAIAVEREAGLLVARAVAADGS